MLLELRLKNLAIVSELGLELEPGLTVLTGETGAGKSLMVEALKILWGARASSELIRLGAEEATVEAVFRRPKKGPAFRVLRELDLLPSEDDDLVIRRSIRRDGRAKAFVADRSVTVSTLAAVTLPLISVVSQHEHQTLVDAQSQLELLDDYSGNESLLEKVAAAWDQWQTLERERETLLTDARGRLERLDYLNFVLKEIEEAALEPGEDARLKAERKQLLSLEKIVRLLAGGVDFLAEGENPAGRAVARIADGLRPLSEGDPKLENLVARLASAAIELDDLGGELSDRLEHLKMSPEELSARLNEIESRLALIERLSRKHGATVEEILERTGALAAERDRLANFDSASSKLDGAISGARRTYDELCSSLDEKRRKGAGKLSGAIRKELAGLNFLQADFKVAVDNAEASATGKNRSEFLFSANPGEPPRPLARVASGGELSRVMLAVRLCRLDADENTTLVLDEIDAGIGGVTAEKVGNQIRRLSEAVQIICVTHLPQIACRAAHHIRVEKRVAGQRSEVFADRLDYDERVEELARMLGGESAAAATRTTAREMLNLWKQANG